MKDAIPTPINQLQPYKKAVKIQVLCTMWRARIPETADKYMGLRCILIDEKQRRSLTSRSNARVTLSIAVLNLGFHLVEHPFLQKGWTEVPGINIFVIIAGKISWSF
ncbi:uncharacterized protein [Malus domestica]|uniref:uncharacterized protein isoform X3 n=1 Tax=Malus domestica TaxID=3750 RepID=UPI00397496AB